ncbi:MAG: ATP synthase F1 subunit gamma, partial [Patescibacteria group bacterium]
RSRLYAEYSWDILTSISKNVSEIPHPFFNEREVKNILLVLITSNRGLCGAYNAQVIKKTIHKLKGFSGSVSILNIGKKGNIAMQRTGQNVIAGFTELPDNITLQDISPIAKLIIDEYSLGHYDKVFIAYTDFISALTQKPNIKQLLPIYKSSLRELIDNLTEGKEEIVDKREINKIEQKTDYLFEGDRDKFIEVLAEKLTKMQIYQMLLESNASEQSSRMISMKNASEASGEMIDDLTLVFNKARQSNITREISEISAGMASVS